MLTRRCVQRRFLLLPDEQVTQVLLYCLGLAVMRHGVEISALCALANHLHQVLRDVRGELPRFAQQFLGNVARALNFYRGRSESFWAPGSYSAVRCTDDAESVLRRLVYVITNAVEAGLVERPEDWPGFCTLPEDIGTREFVIRRPSFFFRSRPSDNDPPQEGPETARDRARRSHQPAREPLPEEVRFKLTKPREFSDMSDEEFRQLLRARVDARVAEIHAERAAEGKPFLGKEKILAQDPNGFPSPQPPKDGRSPDLEMNKGSLNPRLSWSDRWTRHERTRELLEFWLQHREARDRFRSGEREVVFPRGTWLAVRVNGARAAPTAMVA